MTQVALHDGASIRVCGGADVLSRGKRFAKRGDTGDKADKEEDGASGCVGVGYCLTLSSRSRYVWKFAYQSNASGDSHVGRGAPRGHNEFSGAQDQASARKHSREVFA